MHSIIYHIKIANQKMYYNIHVPKLVASLLNKNILCGTVMLAILNHQSKNVVCHSIYLGHFSIYFHQHIVISNIHTLYILLNFS